MTTVIKTDGTVQEFQVGPADLLASATLATSLWNHFGGLETLVRVIQYIPGIISPKRVDDLEFTPQTLPATCHILTIDGISCLDDNDPGHCFGGDPRTQLVGFTICALSHLFGYEFAVRMFMKYMTPALLEESVHPGVKDLLWGQLTDNATRIIREGVSRSLPSRFEEAVKNVGLPAVSSAEGRSLNTDDHYIGGLLRWVVQRHRSHYLTRSADVVRVAACLKSVGWLIGPIRISTNDTPPSAYDGLTLVTSGSYNTDILASEDDDEDVTSEGDIHHIHHYRTETVGSMLFLASGGMMEMSPEKIQGDYYKINAYIRNRLRFTWIVERHDEDGLAPSLHARPQWTRKPQPNRLAVALACKFFPSKTADNVAECFRDLATEKIAKEIRNFEDSDSDDSEPESVKHWKIIVVCIVLSIAEILGGENYGKLAHATELDLYRACNYTGDTAMQLLSGLLRDFEQGLHSGSVLRLLATCHGGLSLHFEPSDKAWDVQSIIGYQGNGYTVLPALLFNMSVHPDSIGFRCDNRVFANFPSHDREGLVETASSDNWASYATGTEDGGAHAIVDGRSGFVNEPQRQPPDAPLYLNFERARLDYAPMQKQIALIGRIHGEVIGVSGIYDIMVTMVNSFGRKKHTCPGHSAPAKALVIRASAWMAKRRRRPMDGTNQFHTYIPIQGSDKWALFLAGQIAGIDGRICFDCYDCTLEADNRHPAVMNPDGDTENDYPRVVIGF